MFQRSENAKAPNDTKVFFTVSDILQGHILAIGIYRTCAEKKHNATKKQKYNLVPSSKNAPSSDARSP